jgi:hypothetical protein
VKSPSDSMPIEGTLPADDTPSPAVRPPSDPGSLLVPGRQLMGATRRPAG